MTLLAALAVLSLLAQTRPSQPSQPSLNGIDPAAIDRAASPCNDFYQYACGLWMRNNPIPSDQASWGRFPELATRNREILRGILEKAADGKAERTPVEQKIGDYYASCMDEKTVDAKGGSPIQPGLDGIDALTRKESLARLSQNGDVFLTQRASCLLVAHFRH
jgi:putative endopeptidase